MTLTIKQLLLIPVNGNLGQVCNWKQEHRAATRVRGLLMREGGFARQFISIVSPICDGLLQGSISYLGFKSGRPHQPTLLHCPWE